MSIYHKVDVDGCDDAMAVLSTSPTYKVDRWEHTEGEKDFYDIGATAGTYTYAIENKDRRWKWENGKPNYNKPQYISTYPSIMFNLEKVEKMMELYNTTGRIPIYTTNFSDGVIYYDLRKLPMDKVFGEWTETRTIGKNTVENGTPLTQLRTFLPLPNNENKYGKIVWRS